MATSKTICYRLNYDKLLVIHEYCRETGVSLSALSRMAILKYLKDTQHEGKAKDN